MRMIGESWSSETLSAAACFKSGPGLMTWSRRRRRDERFESQLSTLSLNG
jgi:hypothetical protein